MVEQHYRAPKHGSKSIRSGVTRVAGLTSHAEVQISWLSLKIWLIMYALIPQF